MRALANIYQSPQDTSLDLVSVLASLGSTDDALMQEACFCVHNILAHSFSATVAGTVWPILEQGVTAQRNYQREAITCLHSLC